MVRVLAPAVPDECVKLPEPVNDPTLKLVFAISNVPLVIVSSPEIVAAAARVTPAALLTVRLLYV
jgi:hypothetical protein